MATVESEPLLPLGRHELTLNEMRTLCVQAFPTSRTRAALMSVLEDLVSRLSSVGLEMEVWIDGRQRRTRAFAA